MALILDVANTWSAPVTLSANEVWQSRQGRVFVTTTATPAAEDGIVLNEIHAVQFSAGLSVRYRKEGAVDAVIVREQV